MQFTGHQFLLPIKDVEDRIVPRNPDSEKKGNEDPLTVKQVVRSAIVAALPSISESEDEKYANYQLAKSIIGMSPESTIELTAEQIAKIKKKVSLSWGIEVMGFVFDVLEGRNKSFKVVSQND